MHGYGFWTFGWLQAEREAARISRFDERWQRLVEIHKLVIDNFLDPLGHVEDQMTLTESQKLSEYIAISGEWLMAINDNIEIARQNNLSRYATSIKKTTLKAIALCKKYGIYKDIVSFGYDAQAKMIVLNGRDLYYLG